MCSSLTLLRSQEKEWGFLQGGAKRTQVQVQRLTCPLKHKLSTMSPLHLPAQGVHLPPEEEEDEEREGATAMALPRAPSTSAEPRLSPLPSTLQAGARRGWGLTEGRGEGAWQSRPRTLGAGVEMERSCHSKNQTSSGVTPTQKNMAL